MIHDPRAVGGTPLRVAVRPDPGAYPNPYLRLFYRALEPHVDVVGPVVINDDWLRERAAGLDALHFHWPESVWRFEGAGGTSRRRLVGFVRYLRLAARLGIRCIWTVHNIAPHEGRRVVDYAGFFALARMADLLVCHSSDAARRVRRWYRPRGELVVMPIGNYAGVYPPPRERSSVLRDAGLDPRRPVVACLGDIRPYKGLDVAVEALARLSGSVQAIVAGQPLGDAATARQIASARGLTSALVVPRRLSDQEFADFAAAADVVWLPYHRVTGSSALLASLTLGTRVIASDLPFFREILAGHELAGRLVPPGDAAALAAATTDLLAGEPGTGREAALALAARYDWKAVIPPVAAALDRFRASREAQQPRRGETST